MKTALSGYKGLRRAMAWLAASAVIGSAVWSCTIEPPLHLADGVPVDIDLPEVQTELDIIWDIDYDWRLAWKYGWDETDEALFGTLDYPAPTTYEARIYYLGLNGPMQDNWLSIKSEHIEGTRFTRRFDFGYYDMLLWSNIDSDDGTQVLRIVESDPGNIFATTSPASLSYAPIVPSRGSIHNNPEIFYSGLVDDFYVSKNPDDYDDYDEDRRVWVKHLDAMLYPMVYTYLVQVIMYDNNGRIVGTAERSAVTSMADAVSLHTGHTSMQDVSVTYDMRMKKDLKGYNDRKADILGGKLTTFGLCDMEPRSRARTARYSGSRGDLRNHVMLDLRFNNATDSVYMYDVTEQMQSQSHGGVITIEIDVDTLTIPSGRKAPGSMFDPTVADPDSVTHVFDM